MERISSVVAIFFLLELFAALLLLWSGESAVKGIQAANVIAEWE